jgi:hypothetical protein
MTDQALVVFQARPSLVYTPLATDVPQIRLLVLKAFVSDDSEPIQCSLKTVNLDDGPEFKALSYVWGEPNDRQEIIVNGCVFMVTTNLFSALHHIRTSYGRLVIWIDAICAFCT